jgi:hypothetical protein
VTDGPVPLDDEEIREAVWELLSSRVPASLLRVIGKQAYLGWGPPGPVVGPAMELGKDILSQSPPPFSLHSLLLHFCTLPGRGRPRVQIFPLRCVRARACVCVCARARARVGMGWP